MIRHRFTLGAVVGFLAIAATVGAQPLVLKAPVVGPAPYAVMVLGNVADLWTTQQAFTRGAVEGNGMIGGNPIVKIAAMKVSFTFAVALAMKTLAAHGHPKAARVLGYVDGGLTFAVSAHNHRVAR